MLFAAKRGELKDARLKEARSFDRKSLYRISRTRATGSGGRRMWRVIRDPARGSREVS